MQSRLPELPDTCQDLHSWNVNDADEELKVASPKDLMISDIVSKSSFGRQISPIKARLR